MSWLYEAKKPVPTKHNGTMMLSRFFGVWTLWGHDGTYQSAPYMDGVWQKTIRHLRWRGFDPKRCLVLGVAMGSTFGLLQRAWPDVDIVGIDWEPALYELGQRLGVYRPDSRVQFFEGDAAVVVPTLKGEFDVVIIDLFNGKKVTEAVSNPALQEAVTARLAPGAIVAVNCYNQRAALDGWCARLGEPKIVRYVSNDVGVFTAPQKPTT